MARPILKPLLALLLLGASLGPAHAQAYLLTQQDRVRITIYEWPELSGEYRIGADGTVSVPFIGTLDASGMSAPELADAVARALQSRASLAEAPSTIAEVIEYKPLYVLGDVEEPGAYSYSPGMVVLNALSVAGGYYRPANAAMMRLERDSINARGEQRQLDQQLLLNLAKLARFEAELGESPDLFLDDRLASRSSEPAVAAVIAAETLALTTARADRQRQLDLIDAKIAGVEKQLDMLQSQVAAQEEDLVWLQEQLDTVLSLTEQGLTTASRRLTLQTEVTDTRQKIGDLNVSIVRAQQSLVEAEAEKNALTDAFNMSVNQSISDTRAEIARLEARLETTGQLAYEAEVLAPGLMTEQENLAVRSFAIFRSVDGAIEEIAGEQTTALLPGDIIEVRRNPVMPQD